MDLKDFVKSALIQLDSAVQEAGRETRTQIAFSQNEQTSVQFDVAVTTEDSKALDGGGAIKVFSFAEVKGGKSKESKTSTVSRISFSVVMW